jgi:hypothetical protein
MLSGQDLFCYVPPGKKYLLRNTNERFTRLRPYPLQNGGGKQLICKYLLSYSFYSQAVRGYCIPAPIPAGQNLP